MINVILLCAGESTRLRSKENFPKPIIKYKKKYLSKLALESFKKYFKEIKVHVVLNQSHIKKFNIKQKLKKQFRKSRFIVLKKTNSQLHSAYQALKKIKNNYSIIFLDCDLSFDSTRFFLKIKSLKSKESLLLLFKSKYNGYSYAKYKGENIIKIKEKKVISNYAIAGSYFLSFTSKELLAFLKKFSFQKNSKLYISDLLNILLKNKKIIKFIKLNKLNSFGTEKELVRFKNTIKK